MEHLADHVAGAPLEQLAGEAARHKQRFEAIQAQLDAIEASDRAAAEKYFPPEAAARPREMPLRDLAIDGSHLELLGVQGNATMVQLADAVVATLVSPTGPPGRLPVPLGPRGLPPRAYFLEDVNIDPTKPAPRQEDLDELGMLREEALRGEALRWEAGKHL